MWNEEKYEEVMSMKRIAAHGDWFVARSATGGATQHHLALGDYLRGVGCV